MAGATIAAENGATEHQLMAIYGWESPKQAAPDTRHADRRRLTGDAMHLIAVARPADAGQVNNQSESPEPLIARCDSLSVKKELKNNGWGREVVPRGEERFFKKINFLPAAGKVERGT